MTKKRMTIKDKKVRALLKEGGRKDAQKDFYELLRRAVTTPVTNQKNSNTH